MVSFIEEFFAGNLNPGDSVYPSDPEYKPVIRKIQEEMDYFESKLSEEDAQRLIKLDELKTHLGSMSSESYFSYGFRLGAILMVEILANPDPLF